MISRPPRPTPYATRLPSTTLFRSRCNTLPGRRHRYLQHTRLSGERVAAIRHHRATSRRIRRACLRPQSVDELMDRSEEHTSELQSLMRLSYAVFGLKKEIR